MLFRILLTAYVSLVAACGPALCCCSFGHLAAPAEAHGCCARNAQANHGHDHAGHSHEHGGHKHHHQSSAAANTNSGSEATSESNAPRFCDEHHCGCDREQRQLVSPSKKDSDDIRRDLQHDLRIVVISTDQLFAIPRTESLSLVQSPIAVYGREMLRAYQILLI